MQLAEQYLEHPIKQPNIEGEFFFEYIRHLDEFNISRYVEVIWEDIQRLDKRITETEPFKVVKINPEKGEKLIANQANALYLIAHFLGPIMPTTSKNLKKAILTNKKPDNLFPRKE